MRLVPRTGNRTGRKATIREENERAIVKAAEEVFAERGYQGATTGEIAERAGVPKANLHYYFPTKNDLYQEVLARIFSIWQEAADALDDQEHPVEALTRYIYKKMEISRTEPLGSKIWAQEVMHGAPVIHEYLEKTLNDWTTSRVAMLERWINDGRIHAINPHYLLYMIWATTQHYADFERQISTLNDDRPMSDAQWEEAKKTVAEIILRGIGAIE